MKAIYIIALCCLSIMLVTHAMEPPQRLRLLPYVFKSIDGYAYLVKKQAYTSVFTLLYYSLYTHTLAQERSVRGFLLTLGGSIIYKNIQSITMMGVRTAWYTTVYGYYCIKYSSPFVQLLTSSSPLVCMCIFWYVRNELRINRKKIGYNLREIQAVKSKVQVIESKVDALSNNEQEHYVSLSGQLSTLEENIEAVQEQQAVSSERLEAILQKVTALEEQFALFNQKQVMQAAEEHEHKTKVEHLLIENKRMIQEHSAITEQGFKDIKSDLKHLSGT